MPFTIELRSSSHPAREQIIAEVRHGGVFSCAIPISDREWMMLMENVPGAAIHIRERILAPLLDFVRHDLHTQLEAALIASKNIMESIQRETQSQNIQRAAQLRDGNGSGAHRPQFGHFDIDNWWASNQIALPPFRPNNVEFLEMLRRARDGRPRADNAIIVNGADYAECSWSPTREKPEGHTQYAWADGLPARVRTIRYADDARTALLLSTPLAVWNEARVMQHCIWNNYRKKIARGWHLAWHLDLGEGPGCTMGLEHDGLQWRQVMLSGYANARPGVAAGIFARYVAETLNATHPGPLPPPEGPAR